MNTIINSTPTLINDSYWHLPLIRDDDLNFEKAGEYYYTEDLIRISVGRCARVSYLTHHGTRDPQADIDLHDRLLTSGHWSPFEHVAYAAPGKQRYRGESYTSGNFQGWVQYRKQFEGESGR